jgi:integrase
LENLGDYFDGKYVSDLTPALIKKYPGWRVAKGDARTKNKPPRKLKLSTARNDLIVLKTALRFAVKEHKLAYSPPIELPPPSDPRTRALTRSEAARLVAAALGWDQTGKRNRKRINRGLARMILIGLYTGTRKDRVLRLQWVESVGDGWIDLDRAILHRRARGEAETKKRAPSVPIGERLMAHLRRWHRLGGRYVIERNGRPVKGIFNGFERVCRDAGLNYTGQDEDDRVTPHILRHTCVTSLLADGWSCKQVGDYVGMTEQMVQTVYGHADDDVQRAIANTIGRRKPALLSQEIPKKLPARA